MSHERDAIARAFSRPFIEPPKRATAMRVGFREATFVLLALALAAFIAYEHLPEHAGGGVACTMTTTTKDSFTDHGQPKTGQPETLTFEFLPGNRARLVSAVVDSLKTDATAPMTTTDRAYIIGEQHNWPDITDKKSDGSAYVSSGFIINRATGELASERDSYDANWSHSEMATGTCHAIHIAAKM
jgi:hypothetical protein